jgi:hypothetical protein
MAEQSFEITNEERDLAGVAVAQYIGFLRGENDNFRGFAGDRPLRLADGATVPLSDVNENVRQIKADWQICQEIGVDIPHFETGSTRIPIHLAETQFLISQTGDDIPRRLFRDGLYFPWPDFYYYLNRYLRESKSPTLAMVSEEQSLEHTATNLRSFIEARISGVGRWIKSLGNFGGGGGGGSSSGGSGGSGGGTGSGGGSVPYVTISVSTVNLGLQLDTAPAYFIRWAHFGHPTSPVTNVIMPGRYLFRGRGPILPSFIVDPVPVDIPPNLSISLYAL